MDVGTERDGGGQAGGVHSRHQRMLPPRDRGVLQPQLLQGPPGQDRRVPTHGGMIQRGRGATAILAHLRQNCLRSVLLEEGSEGGHNHQRAGESGSTFSSLIVCEYANF